jgi:hypothetical protein
MPRRRVAKPTPDASMTEAALDAMDADELRALLRGIIPWLDESAHARLVNALVDRAARSPSGWVPDGPTDAVVTEIVAFAEAAKRVGAADPTEVDDYLRQGSNAFLRKDYGTAYQMFRALLLPVGNVDIDLGQHETLDEVLGVDVAACAAQYVVCVYMTATPKGRGKAVLSAIDEMHGIGHFWEPLRELERVSVEPLPVFDDFLVQWRGLVEERMATHRRSDWDSDEDRWLREAVQRSEGSDGLATVARASKRAGDLRAWCGVLVEARDWEAALSAYAEAAELVTDRAYALGDFLDGAALAAQELGRRDLPRRLESAWREAPSMVRLRRWLGSSTTTKVFRKRVAEALSVCPTEARRQRALLHVLEGDVAAAVKLLAAAPGLGWSDGEHPGHLLFPLVASLVGGVDMPKETARDVDDLCLLADRDEPRLQTPDTAALLELANVTAPSDGTTRAAVMKAMRKAAEKRIAGVTEHKRRRHYGHAASLALACAEIDGSAETASWLVALVDEYRRYPALQRALGQRGARR